MPFLKNNALVWYRGCLEGNHLFANKKIISFLPQNNELHLIHIYSSLVDVIAIRFFLTKQLSFSVRYASVRSKLFVYYLYKNPLISHKSGEISHRHINNKSAESILMCIKFSNMKQSNNIFSALFELIFCEEVLWVFFFSSPISSKFLLKFYVTSANLFVVIKFSFYCMIMPKRNDIYISAKWLKLWCASVSHENTKWSIRNFDENANL